MYLKRKRNTMKRTTLVLLIGIILFAAVGCTPKQAALDAAKPSVDTITAASGQLYYPAGSYDLAELQAVLAQYPYKATVGIATTNSDGSPNLAVAIPAITSDGKYLKLGLADNRTKNNLTERELTVVMFYEYNPTAAEKSERNRGCRVVARYVGEKENSRLNKEANDKNPSLYLEIVELLPIG